MSFIDTSEGVMARQSTTVVAEGKQLGAVPGDRDKLDHL